MYPLFVQVKKSLIDIKTLFFKRDQEGGKRAAEIINTTIGFNKLLGQATCGIFFSTSFEDLHFQRAQSRAASRAEKESNCNPIKMENFHFFIYNIYF